MSILWLRQVIIIESLGMEPHAVPDSAPNWQFLIDAFSNPNDTSSSPINLRIGSLLVRRCQVKYDRLYEPRTPKHIDPNHLSISDLSVTARLGCLTPDSVSLNLSKLAFCEPLHQQSPAITTSPINKVKNTLL